jgi:hypothetical protein
MKRNEGQEKKQSDGRAEIKRITRKEGRKEVGC